jgi:hypothetical protein
MFPGQVVRLPLQLNFYPVAKFFLDFTVDPATRSEAIPNWGIRGAIIGPIDAVRYQKRLADPCIAVVCGSPRQKHSTAISISDKPAPPLTTASLFDAVIETHQKRNNNSDKSQVKPSKIISST